MGCIASSCIASIANDPWFHCNDMHLEIKPELFTIRGVDSDPPPHPIYQTTFLGRRLCGDQR